LSGSADQSSGTPSVSSATNVIIGNDNAQAKTFDGYLSHARVYDEIISEYKRNELYEEFASAQSVGEPKKLDYPAPEDLSELVERQAGSKGLVWGNAGQIIGGNVVDLSGLNNPGAITGAISTIKGVRGDATKGDNSTGYADTGVAPTAEGTIACLFKYDGDTISTIAGRHTSAPSARCYLGIDGTNKLGGGIGTDSWTTILGDTLISNSWNTGILTWDGTTVNLYQNGESVYSAAQNGSVPTGTFGFHALHSDAAYGNKNSNPVDEALIFDYAFSAQEAKDYHNQFANLITYNPTVEDSGADGVAKTPEGFIKGTGTFKVMQMLDSSEVPAYSTSATKFYEPIKLYDRYIECTSPGTIAVLLPEAFGEWEFNALKGGGSNSLDIYFSADDIGTVNYNYLLQLSATERIGLFRRGGIVLGRTDIDYVNDNQWYNLQVLRKSDCEFTMYADGEIVDVSGGSGTNPITDSTYTTGVYMVLDLDAGDCVQIKPKKFGVSI